VISFSSGGIRGISFYLLSVFLVDSCVFCDGFTGLLRYGRRIQIVIVKPSMFFVSLGV